MDQNDEVEHLIQHLANTINRQVDQAMQEKIGIGLAQYKILRHLEQQPTIRQYQVAQALSQTEASVSRQIKLLTNRGLLTSQINPGNRREHINVLTVRGQKMTQAAGEVMGQYTKLLLTDVPDKQQKQLMATLTVLHEHVCRKGGTVCTHAAIE